MVVDFGRHLRRVAAGMAWLVAATVCNADESSSPPPPRDEAVVSFPVTSGDLPVEGEIRILQVVERLKADRRREVRLSGQADVFGSREYCLATVESCMSRVEEALIGQGVRLGQIERVSSGCDRRDPCTSDACGEPVCRVKLRIEEPACESPPC